MTAAALLVVTGIVFWLYGALTARRVLDQLHYHCSFSVQEASEGDEVMLVETVENSGFLPVQWLKVQIFTSRWLDFARTRSVVAQGSRYVNSSFSLSGFEKITRRWKVRCLKRGIYRIETVSLTGGALILAENRSVPVGVGAEIIVFPAPIDLEQWVKPVNMLSGEQIVRRFVLEDPFLVSGAREYRDSDPMNRIHWNASARHNKLMVRKNDYTSHMNLRILLNVQSREQESIEVLDKEVAETGIRVAAGMIRRAMEEGVPVGLATNGLPTDELWKSGSFSGTEGKLSVSAIRSGQNHARNLMTALAGMRLETLVGFEELILSVSRESAGDEVAVITAYASARLAFAIHQLKRNCGRVRIIFTQACYIPEELLAIADIHVLGEAVEQS